MTVPCKRPVYLALLWLLFVLVMPAYAALPKFAEVTKEAGIDFRYINGASGAKYMPEAVGSGAAFFDGDGDGLLDLYIVNGAALPGYTGPTGPNVYYRNLGDGTFVDQTAVSGTGDEAFGMAATVGDVDADGANAGKLSFTIEDWEFRNQRMIRRTIGQDRISFFNDGFTAFNDHCIMRARGGRVFRGGVARDPTY